MTQGKTGRPGAWIVALTCMLLALAAWQLYGWWPSIDAAPPTASTSAAAAGALPDEAATQAAASTASSPAEWARWLAASSLRGTQPDGEWTVGADGHLRPDLALRRRLDHYLALQGESPLQALGEALAVQLAAQHGEAAAADLRALWPRYLALQRHAWRKPLDPADPSTLAAALQERQQVRQQLLGPAFAEAFFRAEDDGLRAAIARWNGGPPMSLAAEVPLALHPAPLADALVRQDELQQAWHSWERRLSDAQSEQLRLHADPGLSAAQRRAAMQAYLQANFSGAELPRVEALLRLMPK